MVPEPAELRGRAGDVLVDVVRTRPGGRLDYLDGRPVASIVYKRRAHVINLFVAQAMGPERRATIAKVQGFNIWRWTRSDLGFWAASDINAEELQEFVDKLNASWQASAKA